MASRGAPAGIGQRCLQSLCVGEGLRGRSLPHFGRQLCTPTITLLCLGASSAFSLLPPPSPTAACSRGLVLLSAAVTVPPRTHRLHRLLDHVISHMTIRGHAHRSYLQQHQRAGRGAHHVNLTAQQQETHITARTPTQATLTLVLSC